MHYVPIQGSRWNWKTACDWFGDNKLSIDKQE